MRSAAAVRNLMFQFNFKTRLDESCGALTTLPLWLRVWCRDLSWGMRQSLRLIRNLPQHRQVGILTGVHQYEGLFNVFLLPLILNNTQSFHLRLLRENIRINHSIWLRVLNIQDVFKEWRLIFEHWRDHQFHELKLFIQWTVVMDELKY